MVSRSPSKWVVKRGSRGSWTAAKWWTISRRGVTLIGVPSRAAGLFPLRIPKDRCKGKQTNGLQWVYTNLCQYWLSYICVNRDRSVLDSPRASRGGILPTLQSLFCCGEDLFAGTQPHAGVVHDVAGRRVCVDFANRRVGEIEPGLTCQEFPDRFRRWSRTKSIDTPRTPSRPTLLFFEPAGRKIHNRKGFRPVE